MVTPTRHFKEALTRAFIITVAACCIVCVCAQPVPDLRQTAATALPKVEGRIDHMAYDARTGRLFVAALGNNTVEVIDVRQAKVIHTITGLANPQGVGIAPEANHIFVANARDGSCRIFDTESYRPIGSVDLKSDADNVRYDAEAKRIYVGYGDGALAVLDSGTGKRLSDIKLPAHPESFQLESKGGRIFVNLPEADGTVAVIDRSKRQVVKTWSIRGAKANFPMALDEIGHRLFIGCRNPARLVVLDTDTGKTVDALECVGDSDDVWYDGKASRVYASGGEGFVSIFARADGGHYKGIGRIPTATGARTSYFAARSRSLYVAVPHRGAKRAEIRVYAADGS